MLTAVGRVICLYLLYHIVSWVLWIWGPRNIRVDKLGKWIVVTGCTSGIGEAMVLELAKRYPRSSFCLIGRSESKLKNTTSKIKATHNYIGHVETVNVDFSHATVDSIEAKLKRMSLLDVGLILNCVGESYKCPLYWHEIDPVFANRLVQVNIISCLGMVKTFIQGMEERERGAIVLFGSGTNVTGEPLHSGYVASKAAVKALAQSLQNETRSRNVLVQCHQPGFVESNMTAAYKGALGMVSAKSYAWYAVQMLERSRLHWLPTPTTFSPHPFHAFVLWAYTLLPSQIGERYRMNFRSSRRRKLMSEKTA
eukprot:Gregarina_sp_Poly_1__8358@NODE_48_length_17742_cov_51_152532_g42_i0_p5_GENE_NODE_48_length_17742_cov_51_152532_g42_i0NODE_48_length_17742_cov_51_152532_g42_i0_p5_ORF_typecomplete_len310_score21_81adh_short/PF00106_25/3_4e33adh_short_C2/PF13561_6/2_9e22KR/PF08659_10/1_6e10Sacchrp_dh_NADP/PF03435_18/7_5e08Sacchrp_dh_NADP/PF03435_18/1_9e03DUF1776/PF08643_10/6_1e03DUF1776/PF08643_10/0_00053NAD_binding_4/PF07993_12/0_37NAD_binding_4/PF07993_12/15Polysacc_synt_2/PF02719_15/0_022Epimerase/PF01370_21/0_